MFGYEEKLDWILKYEEKKRVIKERKRPCWRVREMPMQRGLRALDLREEEKYKYPLHDFPFATFNCLSFVFVFVFVGSSSLSVSLLSIPLSLSCLSSLIWDCIRIGHFFLFLSVSLSAESMLKTMSYCQGAICLFNQTCRHCMAEIRIH